MTSPLKPEINIVDAPTRLGVCGCCATESADGSVKQIQFRWREREGLRGGAIQGGGTAITLCRECRKTAALKLLESL